MGSVNQWTKPQLLIITKYYIIKFEKKKKKKQQLQHSQTLLTAMKNPSWSKMQTSLDVYDWDLGGGHWWIEKRIQNPPVMNPWSYGINACFD